MNKSENNKFLNIVLSAMDKVEEAICDISYGVNKNTNAATIGRLAKITDEIDDINRCINNGKIKLFKLIKIQENDQNTFGIEVGDLFKSKKIGKRVPYRVEEIVKLNATVVNLVDTYKYIIPLEELYKIIL